MYSSSSPNLESEPNRKSGLSLSLRLRHACLVSSRRILTFPHPHHDDSYSLVWYLGMRRRQKINEEHTRGPRLAAMNVFPSFAERARINTKNRSCAGFRAHQSPLWWNAELVSCFSSLSRKTLGFLWQMHGMASFTCGRRRCWGMHTSMLIKRYPPPPPSPHR